MNKTEQKFYETVKNKGYTILKGGWPDFALLTPDNQMFLVEVKSNQDRLRSSQKKMFKLLKKVGLQVFIAHNGKWPPIPFEDFKKKIKLDILTLTEKDRKKFILYLNSKIGKMSSGTLQLKKLFYIIACLKKNDSITEIIQKNLGFLLSLEES